jgi:mRNA interferase RelE/StbE
MDFEQFVNQALATYKVNVLFSQNSLEDLKSYPKEQQKKILSLIIQRGKSGPLIKPDGLGEPLRGELNSFTKIKPKALGLRIIYRPMKNGWVRMEIIAIGPRDKKKVYRMAAERMAEFRMEMAKK